MMRTVERPCGTGLGTTRTWHRLVGGSGYGGWLNQTEQASRASRTVREALEGTVATAWLGLYGGGGVSEGTPVGSAVGGGGVSVGGGTVWVGALRTSISTERSSTRPSTWMILSV